MADNKYKLQFTLSNGETINAGEIVAPQGPKGDKGDSADIPYSSSTPFMDGEGSVGSANTVARGDHRHPSDTSRQEKLVSGENIKTINGQSVLGSGDIPISGGGSEYENTSETVELTNTYTSLNTLCSDILTNKTKVSYVAYSKVSGITSLVVPAGEYGATNGYLYFKVASNGRTVSTGATTSADVEPFIEVFYADSYTDYNGRRLTGLLYSGAYGANDTWYFSGWVDPIVYENSNNTTNINYRTLASKVYIWVNQQNGEFWQIDSSGIVKYYHGAIYDRVLISGPNGNTKTINGETIYGSGDITVGGSKYYKHYLEIDFIHNTSSDTATIYMTDINYASGTISDAGGFANSCFPAQESPTYPATYHEATGFYGNTPIVAIKYTASKIYAVTTTGEKEITPSVGMWVVIDYVIDLSTNMKPVTT